MKKLFLLVLVFGIGFSSYAQKHVLRGAKAPNTELQIEKAPHNNGSALTGETPTTKTEMLNGRAVSFVPIGQSGNAYGYYGNSRTYVWADPNLNSVVFTHRMTGGVEVEGNSRISYDVSTDGGSSWTNNVQVYTPTDPGPQYPYAAGRYPQGLIINPEGNTNPDMAYYSYLGASIINTNGIWGGYVYGSNALTETDPPNPTQTLLESDSDYWRLIPDAFTVTQDGVAWYFDGSVDYTSGASEYTGNLILGRGEIVDDEVVYEESLIEFLDPGNSINDYKIAFSPDGQTGYMVACATNDVGVAAYSYSAPYILKTTDGGETWSDATLVQLGGVDGIETIKYHFTDENIMSIDVYASGFERDEVYYSFLWQVDIIVDGQGNPHLVGLVAVSSAEGVYSGTGIMATFHVYSDDGGTTWDADALYDNIFFDGLPAGLEMYNRPYAASTIDGHYLFFSWLDTDLEGAEENSNPNIFVTGYDSEDHTYNSGGVQSVTSLTTYWFSAFYGSMSQYVFADLNEGTQMWDCEIPFVFTEYTDPSDPGAEMNFIYIDGYTLPMPVGVDTHEGAANFAVSQNSPNPAINNTNILVTSEVAGVINLSVSNILGQVIHHESVDNRALAHTFKVDVSNLDSGVYFYTIEIGNRSITKKIIVK